MEHKDRALIAEVVEREMPRHKGVHNKSRLASATGLSRSTIDRVFAADERVEQATFRRIEGAFDWPSDTLLYVGAHDVASLVEIGAPQSIVARVRKDLDNNAGQAGRVVGGQA